MATYSQIKKGAKGEAVSELQRLLNNNGYSLDVDGNFGSKTQAAVRDYQSKNNLTVDGIAGNQTWSALLGSKSNTFGNSSGVSSSNSTANWLADYEGNRPTYSQSQALIDAANMLSQYENNKPGDYQSNYAEQIQNMLDKIMNREDFSYDFASDPMYQQYAERYKQQGKLAMMDTMGQAAALTGGYGNSYSQSVGQQAYQGYLQGLNDIIPDLQSAAYNMYRDEGNDMYNQLNLLQGLDSSDYGRYRDTVSDYYNDLNYYYNKYNDMSSAEYNRYLNDLAAWQADRAYYYGKQQDAQAQANWQAEFDLAANAAKSGGSSVSSGGGKTSGYNNGSLTSEQVKMMQSLLGVTADGKWGSQSAAAANGMNAEEAWNYMQNNGLLNGQLVENNSNDADVINQHGDSWIHVPGYGRLTWQELYNYVEKGLIKESYIADKNAYGYVKK